MRNNIYLFLTLCLAGMSAHAQNAALPRTGSDLPSEGTIRALVFFAQVKGNETPCAGWNSGQLPDDPESIIDIQVQDKAENYKSFYSHLFKEASLGRLNIVGDYYPEPFYINSFYDAGDEVEAFLKSNKSFTTANGYIYPDDFDNWKRLGKYLYEEGKDSLPDYVLIYIRNDGQYTGTGMSSYIEVSDKDNSDGNSSSRRTQYSMQCEEFRFSMVAAHETAHSYLGDNDFHSGGPNTGDRWYVSDYTGFSLLCNCYNSILLTCNAWDRHWRGWFPPNHTYEIQAQDATGRIVNTDLDYATSFPNGHRDFVLRPTPTSGDAVRIKLPYVGMGVGTDSIPNQYVWLENHQLEANTVDGTFRYNSPDKISPKGLYINYQIGNDKLDDSSLSFNSSISSITSYGNFDYELAIAADGKCEARTSTAMNNPFAGQGLLETALIDHDNNGVLLYNRNVSRNMRERVEVGRVYKDGIPMPQDKYDSFATPFLGNMYQAFRKGDKAYLGGYQTLASRLTWVTGNNMSKKAKSDIIAKKSNRTVYLNGLSVEVLEERLDGAVKVRVRNNNFDVDNNVRWCGNMVLNEKVNLKAGHTIKIDRGLTPTKQVWDSIPLDGKRLFSDVTKFTMNPGSTFNLEERTKLEISGESAFVLESGAAITLADSAMLLVRKGSTLHLKMGSLLTLTGASKVVIEEGAYICVDNNAMLMLNSPESLILCLEGYIAGVGYKGNNTTSCSDIINKPVFGAGKIMLVNKTLYIQNEEIGEFTPKKVYGGSVYVGSEVTDARPKGDVIVRERGKLEIRFDKEAVLDKGFSTEKEAILEIKKIDD